MRWTRKMLILGLAVLGAYRIYELARARAQIAAPPVGDALDTVRETTAKVKDDLSDARIEIADDLETAIAPDHGQAEPEPRMAVADGRTDSAEGST